MTLTIHIKAEVRLHPETHSHRCPYCRQIRDEDNTLCQKTLRGTGLDYHAYICMKCTQSIRRHYGSDWLTAFVDDYAAALSQHVIPQKKVDEREQQEAESNPEIREVLEIARKI